MRILTTALSRTGVVVIVLGLGLAQAQDVRGPAGPPMGTHERIRVYGPSLDGNLAGDSPDRDVSIYLPASYENQTGRRYPVLYLLHGFTDSDHRWYGMVPHFVNVPEVADQTFASGAFDDFIIVTPNAYTAFKGSMYSSSVTTGDWETYVSEDLVAYVDGHYRTLSDRRSRGLAGHSMGGYGAIRIGMKRPDVFSAVYVLSPCCMGGSVDADNPAYEEIGKLQSIREVEDLDFGVSAALASAAAWSPNPDNPPFYVDLPVRDGAIREDVVRRWAGADPLAMVDQYVTNLRKLTALAIDAGDMDRGIAATSRTMSSILNRYGIAHDFEIYEGDHVNRIEERLGTHVFPFFARHLRFE